MSGMFTTVTTACWRARWMVMAVLCLHNLGLVQTGDWPGLVWSGLDRQTNKQTTRSARPASLLLLHGEVFFSWNWFSEVQCRTPRTPCTQTVEYSSRIRQPSWWIVLPCLPASDQYYNWFYGKYTTWRISKSLERTFDLNFSRIENLLKTGWLAVSVWRAAYFPVMSQYLSISVSPQNAPTALFCMHSKQHCDCQAGSC